MLVRFFKWAKFKNSSAIPSGSSYVPVDVYDCQLKDDVSITNPTIAVRFPDQQKITEYGYCYIDEFKRWYYVRDYIFNRTRWILNLEVDPLASFREELRTTRGFVLRSGRWPENYPDDAKGFFTDSIYPAACQAAVKSFDVDSPFTTNYRDGAIVIGVIGAAAPGTTSALGAVSYYLIDVSTFQYLCYSLLSQEAQYTGINGDIMDPNLLRCIFNPLQYFSSVMWFPFNFSGEDGLIENMVAQQSLIRVSSIHYGWWQISGLNSNGRRCYRVESNRGYLVRAQRIRLDHNPDYSEDRKFVDYAPYRKVTFYAYPFGSIPIDLSSIIDNCFGFNFIVDLFTGRAILEVLAMPGENPPDGTIPQMATLYQTETQFAFEIPIAQMATDVIKTGADAISAVSNTIGNAFSLNLTGAISAAAAGISDAIHNSAPQLLTKGTTGSVSFYNIVTWKVTEQFYLQAQYANSIYGFPLCWDCTLDDCFGGYVQVAKSLFKSDRATLSEIEMIDGYLESGFYFL